MESGIMGKSSIENDRFKTSVLQSLANNENTVIMTFRWFDTFLRKLFYYLFVQIFLLPHCLPNVSFNCP